MQKHVKKLLKHVEQKQQRNEIMAVLYSFETEDGEQLSKFFPMGECPNEITLEDGRIAKRTYHCNVGFFSKKGSSGSNAAKLNAEMTRRNEAAGKRMRERWKSCKSTPQN